MLTPIVFELRVSINVVFAVFVVGPLEIEFVGSGKDKGEPTTQLRRRVPSDADAGTADEKFRGEEVCGLGLLKFVAIDNLTEAGKAEEASNDAEVVKGGSAALMF